MFNIFEHYRFVGVDFNGDVSKYIETYQKLSLFGPEICNLDILGKTPLALFDGNSSTSWTNSETDSNNTYFIVHFKENPIFIESFSFKTICDPPTELLISGSNDNSTWINIGKAKNLSKLKFFSVKTKARRAYSFFKVHGSNAYGRLILNSLEFFGSFGNPKANSCKRWSQRSKLYILLFAMIQLK